MTLEDATTKLLALGITLQAAGMAMRGIKRKKKRYSKLNYLGGK